MYDVQDVAEYVITYSEVKDYGISNLKLQKILYLIQAYSLIHTKKPFQKILRHGILDR